MINVIMIALQIPANEKKEEKKEQLSPILYQIRQIPNISSAKNTHELESVHRLPLVLIQIFIKTHSIASCYIANEYFYGKRVSAIAISFI
jgi:hypothetical protein